MCRSRIGSICVAMGTVLSVMAAITNNLLKTIDILFVCTSALSAWRVQMLNVDVGGHKMLEILKNGSSYRRLHPHYSLFVSRRGEHPLFSISRVSTIVNFTYICLDVYLNCHRNREFKGWVCLGCFCFL